MYKITRDGKVFMIAPMDTMQTVFSLHSSAVARVITETANGGTCTLHTIVNRNQLFGKDKSISVEWVDPQLVTNPPGITFGNSKGDHAAVSKIPTALRLDVDANKEDFRDYVTQNGVNVEILDPCHKSIIKGNK